MTASEAVRSSLRRIGWGGALAAVLVIASAVGALASGMQAVGSVGLDGVALIGILGLAVRGGSDDLEHLADAVERLAAGERDVHLSTDREDEVGRLYEAVDDLATSVSEQRQQRPSSDLRERQFEAVFNDPKALFALLDTDGTVQQINETAFEYVDADTDSVTGEPFWSTPWWRDTPRDDVREWIERAAAGEYVEYEASLSTPDGGRSTVTGTFRPVTDDGEVVSIVVSARDITERKSREEELQTTTARLEALFENSPDMIDVLDPEGTLCDVNHRLREELGYSEDELVGRKIWDIDRTVDAEDVQTLFEGMSVGSRRKFESEYERRDGSAFPVEVHLIRLDLEGEDRFVAISRDITERKTHERELRETKRRLEIALKGTNTGVWEWDLETDAVTWDETAERMIGLSPGEFEETFEAFERRLHPDDRSSVEAAVEQAIENDGLFQTEFRLQHEGGHWLWIGARGQIVSDRDGGRRMVGINHDVTDRKEREQQLQQRERELQEYKEFTNDLLDGIDDVFYVLDRDGSLERWNESLSAVTGYSDEEIASMNALDFFAEEDQDDVAAAIGAVFETGSARVEAPFLTKEGESIPYEFIAVSLEDPDGDQVLTGIGRDINERKERERKLRERRQRLERYKEYTDDVLDAIDDVFYLLDDDWNFRRWNQSLCDVTGYTDEEIAEMNALEFFDDDDAKRIDDALDDIESRIGIPLEAALQTRDGGSIPYEFVAAPLENPEGERVIAGIGRDISERREKERQLSRLIDNVPGAVYSADPRLDWPTAFVSEGIREIAGYSPESLESGEVSWAEDVMVEKRDDDWQLVERSLDEHEPFTLTYPIETADGERRWIKEQGRGVYDADGDVEALEGVLIDVTEQIEYEQALERTQKLLEQSQQLARVGAWEVDVRDEPYEITWTDEVYRIHGLPLDTDLDVTEAIEYYHPDDRERVSDTVQRAIDDGEEYDFEARLITADGVERWVRSIGEPVYDDGEIAKIRGSIQDITERKEREAELQRTTDLLQQAQRMAGVAGWELDVSGGPPYTPEWSDGIYELFEIPTDRDLETDEILEFFHPDDRDERRAAFERALERGEGWDEEGRVVTANGTERWMRTIGEPVSDDGAVVKLIGSVQDITDQKEREQALRSLHETTRELLGIETETDVAQLVVETATEVLDVEGASVYVLDAETNRLEPIGATEGFTDDDGGAPSIAVGDENSPVWDCFVTGTPTMLDENSDRSLVSGLDAAGGLLVPIGDHGVFVVATAESPVDDDARRLVETLAATTAAALDRLESESSLREHEAELEARNRRLRRQIQITDIIRSIHQSLIGATSREEIERSVCDRLAAADDVAFAWIGEFDASETGLVPRAWAGTGEDYLDAVSLATDDGPVEPSVATARSATPTVVENVVDDLKGESWRQVALTADFQSVISVPLAFDDYFYGVLTVYADRIETFTDLEQNVFTELGASIANAINDVKTRQALHTDTVVELTLRFERPDSFFATVARRADCTVDYDGFATRSADESRLFFTTTGCSAADAEAVLDDLVAVTDYRLIDESDDESLFEATVSGDVLTARLVRHGARPQSIHATATEMEVVVDVSPTTDVREFVEMLGERYDPVELVGRQTVQRTMHTRRELVASLFDVLTDRQLEVLRTAYFAGFFDWPRKSTGEDIAEMLSVTQPTVNRHLRLAQGRLFEQLFDSENASTGD